MSEGQPKLMERVGLPPEVMQKNEIKDVEAASFFVRQLTKKFPRVTATVGVIPEEEIFRRSIQIPFEENAHEVVMGALPELLPLPPEEMVWEWRIVPPFSPIRVGHQDVEIVALPHPYLLAYYDTMLRAKLSPVNFLPEALGALKLIFPSFESPDASLVVFADRYRTVLVVFAGHAIHVTSVLAYGEHDFSGQGLDALLEEIKRIVAFYRHRVMHEHGASSEVNRIIVFGDIDEEVRTRIAFNTQIRLEHFNVWAGGVATDFVPLIGVARSLLG
ncbi:MAG: hypothetical protein HYS57_02745 [Parcubacteria group bacterium]|nr:hypothetical protein [Parcubacteria group bacterium]